MQKNIAIVMGGYSSEAEISLKSGEVVFNSLDTSKYALYKVYILKDTIQLLLKINVYILLLLDIDIVYQVILFQIMNCQDKNDNIENINEGIINKKKLYFMYIVKKYR